MTRRESPARRVLFAAIYLVMAAYAVLPVLYMISTSFKPNELLLASPPRIIFAPTLDHYRRLVLQDRYYSFFMNSSLAALGGTLIAVFIGALAAFGFTRYRFRGKNVLFWAILIARGLPPATILIPVYLMVRRLGLFDQVAALIIIYASWQVPLAIWVMRAFFAEVPIEIQESAMIDGCRLPGVFFRVMLPLAGPGLLACAILIFALSWNEFLFALVLTSMNARTAPVAITSYLEVEGLVQWGRVAAAGTLTILPVVAFMFLLNRYLVRGLTLGAVKG